MSTTPTRPALRPAATATPRPRLAGQLAIAAAAYAFAVTMLATTVPTPLYDLYRHTFGVSALTVTVIFAIYAVGVIASLLLFERVSDQLGRRPVLLAGLVLAALGMTAFLIADGVALLFVGRFVSGLAAGIFAGTATATLIDLTPPAGREGATMVSTIAQMGGLGLGPLVGGLVAQWAGAPLREPYWVVLALLVPALLGVWALPEPGQRAVGRGRLRPQPLEVPGEARGTFVQAALAAVAGFAVLGLFTALSPTVLAEELAITSPAVVGVVVFGVLAASTTGELVLGRVPGAARLRAGCLILVTGMACLAFSLTESSLVLLLIGGVISGFGQGLSFRAGLTAVTGATPAPQRAEVTCAFLVVAYVALAVSVIGVGVLTQIAGLRTAGLVFTAVVAAIAGAAVALTPWQPSERPAGRRSGGQPLVAVPSGGTETA